MTPNDRTVRPYTPRDAGAAVATSLLLGREPARLLLGDAALTVRFAPDGLDQVQGTGTDALACLEWTLGGIASELLLPSSVVIGLIAPLEEVPDGTLDWATAPMLLELLLAAYLDQAEALLGQPFRLRKMKREQTFGTTDQLAGVALQGALDGAPFVAWLRLAPNALDAMVRLARLLPQGPQQVPDPPVVVAARVGLARLGLRALTSARVGDAVLIEDGPLQRGRVMIVVGECRVASAHWTGNKATLEQPLQPAGAFGSEEWTMQSGHESDPVAATFGDLRVTLVFEVGRRLATLDEVRALAPGQVLDLGRDEAAPVDILANGARLGRGEIVKVGDALAVRITVLHGHD